MALNQHPKHCILCLCHLLIIVFVVQRCGAQTKNVKKDSLTDSKNAKPQTTPAKDSSDCTHTRTTWHKGIQKQEWIQFDGTVYSLDDHYSTNITVCNTAESTSVPYTLQRRADIHVSCANIKVHSIDKCLDAFKGHDIKQDNIKTLLVNNASIDDITPHSLANYFELERLYMGSNNLTKIQSHMLEKLWMLEELNLTHNKLEAIGKRAFHDLCNLKFCDLSHNKLKELWRGHFDHFHNLTFLNVSSNLLRTIEEQVFKNCSKLVTLDISKNRLHRLNPDIFTGLAVVESLDLSWNRLKELWTGVLNGLAKLQYLSLTSNQIDNISPEVFESTPELETLCLTDNTLDWVTPSSFTDLSITTNVTVDDRATCCFIHSANCCVNNSCSTGDPDDTVCHRLLLNQALVVTVWILAFFGIVGNILVIGYQGKQMYRKKTTVHLLLVTNLSTSDLLMGLYMLIIASADLYFTVSFPNHTDIWRYSPLCHFAGIICLVSSEASVCFITLISIERFLCVAFSNNQCKIGKKSATFAILLIWLLTIVVGMIPSIPKLIQDRLELLDICIGLPLSLHLSEHPELLGLVVFIFIFLAFNSLCFLIVAACYIAIMVSTIRSSHKLGRDKLSKRDVRLAKQVAAVVITDFFTWIPIILVFILNLSGVVPIYEWEVTILVALAFTINSCINPFLYTFSALIYEQTQLRKNKATNAHEMDLVSEPSNLRPTRETCTEAAHEMDLVSEPSNLRPTRETCTEAAHEMDLVSEPSNLRPTRETCTEAAHEMDLVSEPSNLRPTRETCTEAAHEMDLVSEPSNLRPTTETCTEAAHEMDLVSEPSNLRPTRETCTEAAHEMDLVSELSNLRPTTETCTEAAHEMDLVSEPSNLRPTRETCTEAAHEMDLVSEPSNLRPTRETCTEAAHEMDLVSEPSNLRPTRETCTEAAHEMDLVSKPSNLRPTTETCTEAAHEMDLVSEPSNLRPTRET